MTSSAARYDSAVEERVLEKLRPRYEDRGYRFIVHPERSSLPAFMHGYVPDAVATSASENIAIEVKGTPSPGGSDSVERLRRLFVGHDDWKFTVVYGGTDPQRSIQIPFAYPDAIEREIGAVEELLNNGHDNAALVMAFALLEASLPTPDDVGGRRPQRPGIVVQTLAINGLVDADREARLRELTDTRDRIVHGDLTARVEPGEAQLLLDIVKALLTSNSIEAAD